MHQPINNTTQTILNQYYCCLSVSMYPSADTPPQSNKDSQHTLAPFRICDFPSPFAYSLQNIGFYFQSLFFISPLQTNPINHFPPSLIFIFLSFSQSYLRHPKSNNFIVFPLLSFNTASNPLIAFLLAYVSEEPNRFDSEMLSLPFSLFLLLELNYLLFLVLSMDFKDLVFKGGKSCLSIFKVLGSTQSLLSGSFSKHPYLSSDIKYPILISFFPPLYYFVFFIDPRQHSKQVMVIFSWEASLLKLESLTPIFKSMLILRFRIPFNIIKMNISGKADIESPKIFSQRTLSLFGSSCFIFFHSKFALSQFISGYYFLFIDSKINLVFV